MNCSDLNSPLIARLESEILILRRSLNLSRERAEDAEADLAEARRQLALAGLDAPVQAATAPSAVPVRVNAMRTLLQRYLDGYYDDAVVGTVDSFRVDVAKLFAPRRRRTRATSLPT